MQREADEPHVYERAVKVGASTNDTDMLYRMKAIVISWLDGHQADEEVVFSVSIEPGVHELL